MNKQLLSFLSLLLVLERQQSASFSSSSKENSPVQYVYRAQTLGYFWQACFLCRTCPSL